MEGEKCEKEKVKDCERERCGARQAEKMGAGDGVPTLSCSSPWVAFSELNMDSVLWSCYFSTIDRYKREEMLSLLIIFGAEVV